MGSIRRATQRAVVAGIAIASVFLLATCDLSKLTTPSDNSGANGGIDSLDLTITGGSEVTLGGTAQLGVTVASVDLSGTATRFTSSAPGTISVDSLTGIMTGVVIGTATLTAKLLAPELGEGVSRSQSVRVRYKGIKITTPLLPDSLTGLGHTRNIVVQGLNNAGQIQGVLASGVVVSSKDTTILKVTGATATARKNGTTFIVAVYDSSLRDSIALKVRRVARRIAFPTTDYTSNALCTGTCPTGGRSVPFSAFDIADTLIVGPTATWRVLNIGTATINASTGLLKVLASDTSNRVFVKVDTVERGQRILVQQVVGKVTRFAGDSQTAQVASLVGIAPQVVVTDSGDTPMAGVSVTFAVTAGGGSVTSATATSDANGRAAVGSWRLGTVAGNAQTLTATAGNASFSFTATSTAGPAARLAFGVQPAAVGTNAAIAPSVTVRVTDTLSNTVTAGSSSVTLALLTNPGAATLGGTLTRATLNGVATFNDITVSATGAGYTLQATAASLTTAASNAFDVFGAANKLAFIVQPANATINQAISPALKVAVQDVNGLTVTTATNTIALSVVAGPSSVLNGVISTAVVNGVATFSSASLPVAGSGYQIRATASPTLANNTVTSNAFIVAAVGPAVKLGFSIQPGDATAGFTINSATGVRVAIQDANGATVTGASASITLSFETNAGNGTLSGSLTQATSLGVATFSGLSINKSGVSYKLRADVSGATLTSATSSAFNITAGTVTKVRFDQQPTAVVAGSAISPAVRVAMADALDNTVTTASANATLTSACATLTGGGSTATSAGVATFSALSISNAGTTCTLTASAGGFGASSAVFNVVAVGGATKIAFISGPSTVTSGAPMQWQVELQNAAGARVTTASASITVAIGNNAGNGTLGGTLTLTTTQGLATFTNLVIGAAGTGYTLAANATGYTAAASPSFNVVPGAATKVAFLTQPSNATAGINLSPSPRVAVQDSAGNSVTSATTPVLMSFNANPGGGAISGTTLVTPVNGIATFDNIRIAKSATGYSFIASVPNTSLTNAISSSFNIAVGTAFGFAFTVQPTNATAGAIISPSIQVQIVDDQGNSVTNASNAITLALSGGTGGAVLNGTTTQTPVSGLAAFANLSVSTQGTVYRLNASASGLTATQSNTFDIAVGTPTKLLFKTQPSIMTVGAASTFTVAIADASNNTVTSASANITLAINTGAGALGGTLTQATLNGVATFSNITLTPAGTYTLLATSSPAYTSAVSSSILVANQQLQISSGNGQTGTVGANVAVNPVVVVRDGAGTPVAGINVTFTAAANGTLNNSSATSVALNSDGSGNASVIWRLRTASFPDTLIAALTSTPGVFVRFTATANPGAAASITKNAGDAQTAVVSTAVAINPTVKVADSFGNGINTASVTFSVLSGGGSITGGSATTNAAGLASVGSWTMGSSAGTNTLFAQSGPFSVSFSATATTSDPCTTFVAHTIGATSNGSLDTADCAGPTTPRDQFNVTTSSANTFFSATLASSAFTPLQYAKVWAPSTSRLGLNNTGSVTLYYLLATAATYGIDVEKQAGSTGSYTLSSTLNPSIPASCVNTLVTAGLSATQTLSTSCTAAHDAGSSIPGRVSSIRYYYMWQPAFTTITVRMNAGTISDPYLESRDNGTGTLLAYNDDDTGLSSVMIIPAPSVGRFVEIRAMHYVASGGPTVSGDFTLIIDP